MHVGFIATTPYQLFYYKKIYQFFDRVTVFAEVRKEDFGLNRELIKSCMPDAEIFWIVSQKLARIDGLCDVLVCQTPVPVLKFFSKSFVVAQQYSLAKEYYQYGLWRAHASLNLMYGQHSINRVRAFSYAVATGNPLLDDYFNRRGLPNAPEHPESPKLKVLYMPTYGNLSDKTATINSLLKEDHTVSIKAHHADADMVRLAGQHSLPFFGADQDPVSVVEQHDLVVSDYSGAIFDSLAVRKPVVLVPELNIHSQEIKRLSEQDIARTDIQGLTDTWPAREPIMDAYERARSKLSNSSTYHEFLNRYYTCLGYAGQACAEAIKDLVARGESDSFAIRQIRTATKHYILENRKLRSAKDSSMHRSFTLPWQFVKKTARRVLQYVPFGNINTPKKQTVLRLYRGMQTMPLGSRLVEPLKRLWARFQLLRWEQKNISRYRPANQNSASSNSLPVTAAQRRQAILALVQPSLQRAGVEHHTYETESSVYCAVRQEDLDRVCAAINRLEEENTVRGFQVWMGCGKGYNINCEASKVTWSQLLQTDSIMVGVPYNKGIYHLLQKGAVEILILEPRDTRLVSKRQYVEKVDWTAEFQNRNLSGHHLHLSQPVSRMPSHALHQQPIDIVYTWVDSRDPNWLKKQKKYSRYGQTELKSAGNEERYLDRDELRYSLRSLWLYAPFIRNIYLVTEGHKPGWLDESHGGIQVIPHEEIFPDPDCLPTFNSHAIEACLHRIPGLSEHFIYFNDDVFLGQETTRETFYTKGGMIKSRFSPSAFTAQDEPASDAIPTDWASYNAIRLIARDFGIRFERKMKHVPMPMKKSLLEEIEERYSEEVTLTRQARFRSHSDLSIPSMFAHYYAIATGKGVEWENIPGEYAYLDTGRWDFGAKLQQIQQTEPTFFCMNVTLHSDIAFIKQARIIQHFLQERFPEPSPMEIKSE